MFKRLFLSILFLIFCNVAITSEVQKLELNSLFDQLKNTKNSSIAKEIENKIWRLWTTHPSEESLTKLLAKGSEYMSQNQLTSAHNVFSKVIELDPNWSEAWNKRATVLYLMGSYELSQNDIDKVLSIEQRHFGALSGQGLVQTKLKNYEKALDSYIKVHKIYPSMKSPIIMMQELKEIIQKESI